MKKLLCYCFGYSEEDIQKDFQTHGVSTLMQHIMTAKQAGSCQCHLHNPHKR